jgi:DNA-binding transcriptional ArsR family regulator
MSQSQLPRGVRDRTDDQPATLTDGDDVQDVLDAVDDADCRAILEATRGESRTVNELSEACDLPQSTAYRKVDVLANAGLLEESLRVRRSGKHVSEYACGVEDVTLSVAADGGIELTVTPTETEQQAGFGGSLAAHGNVADD